MTHLHNKRAVLPQETHAVRVRVRVRVRVGVRVRVRVRVQARAFYIVRRSGWAACGLYSLLGKC